MRREILNEVKIIAFVTLAGMAVFASMLLFGLRAKAATVRDGVHTPVYEELQTVGRGELADMRNAEEWVEPEPAYSADELELLARVIMAEAGTTEDLYGCCLVGNVVLNRVRSNGWPNSIYGVISQPGQFETWSNGAIWAYYPNEQSWAAAEMVLNGWYETNAEYFAMYYIDFTSWATPLFEYGNHRFYV